MMTYLHCLQHSLFKHLFNLFMNNRAIVSLGKKSAIIEPGPLRIAVLPVKRDILVVKQSVSFVIVNVLNIYITIMDRQFDRHY